MANREIPWNLESHTKTQTIVLRDVGSYEVRVQAIISRTDESVIVVYSTQLICKYVKREIRTLTLDDRERFLDSMPAIWIYGQADGHAQYGDRFTSI